MTTHANGRVSEFEELIAEQGEQFDTYSRNEQRVNEIRRQILCIEQMAEQRKAIMNVFEATMLALGNLGR